MQNIFPLPLQNAHAEALTAPPASAVQRTNAFAHEAFNLLARLSLDLQDIEDAIAKSEIVLKGNPLDIKSLNTHARACLVKNRLQEALADLNLINVNATLPLNEKVMALNSKAWVCLILDNHINAGMHLDASACLHPFFNETKFLHRIAAAMASGSSLMHCQSAEQFLSKGMPYEAFRRISLDLESNPSDDRALTLLAKCILSLPNKTHEEYQLAYDKASSFLDEMDSEPDIESDTSSQFTLLTLLDNYSLKEYKNLFF